LERNVTEFLPYTFQILGLLLDATPSVKPIYQELFTRLLTPDLWRAQANVPGLIRLLRAYFSKHALFAQVLTTHMQAILESFQFVLCNRRTEHTALELCNAMYMHLPLAVYQNYFKTLVTVLLTRLQNSKSPRFQKDFVVSLSLFMHRNAVTVLISVFNEIQAGLLSSLLTGIWFPALKMMLRLDERKVCAITLAKLIAADEIRQNVQLFSGCCSCLVTLLGLGPSAVLPTVEEGSDDEPAAGNNGAGVEYEINFNKLQNTDLPGAGAGLAPDVPELHSAAKTLLVPQRQNIAQLAQGNMELQPLLAFLQ